MGLHGAQIIGQPRHALGPLMEIGEMRRQSGTNARGGLDGLRKRVHARGGVAADVGPIVRIGGGEAVLEPPRTRRGPSGTTT